MSDHDLTKSTLYQYALAYLWHWPIPKEQTLKELAWEIVRYRHLELEDHHPEYSDGPVDYTKLIIDRLAVHIQKDGDDGMNGFEITPWLPTEAQSTWSHIRKNFGHINLYGKVLTPDHPLPSVKLTLNLPASVGCRTM